MHILSKAQTLVLAIAAAGVVALVPLRAQASEEFPGAIQEAAGMPCAPSCTLCHGITPGTATTFMNKELGKTLFSIDPMHPVGPKDVAGLKAAYAKYAMIPGNALKVAALKEGKDPQTGEGLCGPTYGCGAHVAKKAPPSDFSAPLWVVGAMVLGGLLRRRKPNAG
jgi:hypothetical protein